MPRQDTELIFPPLAINVLKKLRGEEWQALVEKAKEADESAPEKAAFILMMARLNGCASCNTSAFRSLQGCEQCSGYAIQRYKGTDKELAKEFKNALALIHKSGQISFTGRGK